MTDLAQTTRRMTAAVAESARLVQRTANLVGRVMPAEESENDTDFCTSQTFLTMEIQEAVQAERERIAAAMQAEAEEYYVRSADPSAFEIEKWAKRIREGNL